MGGRKTRLVIGCPGAAEAGGLEAGTGGASSTARPLSTRAGAEATVMEEMRTRAALLPMCHGSHESERTSQMKGPFAEISGYYREQAFAGNPRLRAQFDNQGGDQGN